MSQVERAAWYEQMRERYRQSPIHALLGMELELVEDGRVTVVFRSRPEIRNAMGVIHGGVQATAMDSAILQSVRTKLSEIDSLTTIEIKVNFVVPALGDVFRCEGQVVRVGRSVGVAEAKLRNDRGEVVAVGLGTIHVRRSE